MPLLQALLTPQPNARWRNRPASAAPAPSHDALGPAGPRTSAAPTRRVPSAKARGVRGPAPGGGETKGCEDEGGAGGRTRGDRLSAGRASGRPPSGKAPDNKVPSRGPSAKATPKGALSEKPRAKRAPSGRASGRSRAPRPESVGHGKRKAEERVGRKEGGEVLGDEGRKQGGIGGEGDRCIDVAVTAGAGDGGHAVLSEGGTKETIDVAVGSAGEGRRTWHMESMDVSGGLGSDVGGGHGEVGEREDGGTRQGETRVGRVEEDQERMAGGALEGMLGSYADDEFTEGGEGEGVEGGGQAAGPLDGTLGSYADDEFEEEEEGEGEGNGKGEGEGEHAAGPLDGTLGSYADDEFEEERVGEEEEEKGEEEQGAGPLDGMLGSYADEEFEEEEGEGQGHMQGDIVGEGEEQAGDPLDGTLGSYADEEFEEEGEVEAKADLVAVGEEQEGAPLDGTLGSYADEEFEEDVEEAGSSSSDEVISLTTDMPPGVLSCGACSRLANALRCMSGMTMTLSIKRSGGRISHMACSGVMPSCTQPCSTRTKGRSSSTKSRSSLSRTSTRGMTPSTTPTSVLFPT